MLQGSQLPLACCQAWGSLTLTNYSPHKKHTSSTSTFISYSHFQTFLSWKLSFDFSAVFSNATVSEACSSRNTHSCLVTVWQNPPLSGSIIGIHKNFLLLSLKKNSCLALLCFVSASWLPITPFTLTQTWAFYGLWATIGPFAVLVQPAWCQL